MKKGWIGTCLVVLLLSVTLAYGAYHHIGEKDSGNFLQVHPDKAGTKLDHCALCHSGGSYVNSKGRTATLGSCQWCHYTYGYDASGDIDDTLNPYGVDYNIRGRDAAAVSAIEDLDSDDDGYTNGDEINANRYPGDDTDDPSKVPAPYRVYSRAQLEAMPAHTQFMLMNTSRGGTSGLDSYDEYTGVVLENLLQDAGIAPDAESITAYAADGWAQSHPLEATEEAEMYHINGPYPPATYYYDQVADYALNPDTGWVDYSAPGSQGRSHGDTIHVPNGLRAILAYKHNGTYLDSGVLDASNKLQGEGPLRVVVPQKNPGPPDQPSRSSNDGLIWPYDETLDHSAGACSRTVTIIKVSPLPEGTTDINVLEAGWNYVDQEKIVIYGNISGLDSNDNGILDSEEGTNNPDKSSARLRPVTGIERMTLHTTKGDFKEMQALADDDPCLSSIDRPDMDFPYGAVRFKIENLNFGETVTVSLTFPEAIPTSARYFKIHADGWHEIPFGSNDGDAVITIQLTDNDTATDDDPTPGVILDPGAIGMTATTAGGGGVGTSGNGDSSSCFIDTLLGDQPL